MARVGEGLDAGQRGRGLLELALLHQRVGEEGSQERREEPRRPPRLGGGERLAAIGFRLGQLASPHEGLRAKDLGHGEGVDRTAPVGLGECVVVGDHGFVEVRPRKHGGGEDKGRGRRLPDQRSFS